MRRLFVVYLFFFIRLISPKRIIAIDFQIFNPTTIGQEIAVEASLSASSNYYIQGLLRSQSSSYYFGETQNNNGDWIDYQSTIDKEYIASNFFLTEIKNASWSGTIKIRFKLDDPNYLGPGLYDLKLRRYTGSSEKSAGESNTLPITISVPLQTPSPTLAPSPTPSPSLTPTPIPTPTPTPKPSPIPSPTPSIDEDDEATVAGVSTEIDLSAYGTTPSPSLPGDSRKDGETATSKPKLNQDRLKNVIYIGVGIIILSVAAFFGYRKYSGTIIK